MSTKTQPVESLSKIYNPGDEVVRLPFMTNIEPALGEVVATCPEKFAFLVSEGYVPVRYLNGRTIPTDPIFLVRNNEL